MNHRKYQVSSPEVRKYVSPPFFSFFRLMRLDCSASSAYRSVGLPCVKQVSMVSHLVARVLRQTQCFIACSTCYNCPSKWHSSYSSHFRQSGLHTPLGRLSTCIDCIYHLPAMSQHKNTLYLRISKYI